MRHLVMDGSRKRAKSVNSIRLASGIYSQMLSSSWVSTLMNPSYRRDGKSSKPIRPDSLCRDQTNEDAKKCGDWTRYSRVSAVSLRLGEMMPELLEYARPVSSSKAKQMLGWALLFGLCSAPLACFALFSFYVIGGESVGFIAYLAILIASVTFTCSVRFAFRKTLTEDDRDLAACAFGAPVVGGMLLIFVAIIAYGLTHLGNVF